MDPISMAAGAVPMAAGILDKGLDVAKGLVNLADNFMDQISGPGKIGADTASQPTSQISF
ncbi:hypothetical protein LVW35_22630 [Pseudomonas sp. HN11]|uniref:hypothetical protein n=1 Tax=Pseudomonas sp. HN11 TaxID=1344094 RepID=UPI001F43C494|nr:hypothetical protein [Pseudomonas sp. HN11]UII70427.1 hypothetical protein LVW35_22630 [Pseudomonas sp. HN11]